MPSSALLYFLAESQPQWISTTLFKQSTERSSVLQGQLDIKTSIISASMSTHKSTHRCFSPQSTCCLGPWCKIVLHLLCTATNHGNATKTFACIHSWPAFTNPQSFLFQLILYLQASQSFLSCCCQIGVPPNIWVSDNKFSTLFIQK